MTIEGNKPVNPFDSITRHATFDTDDQQKWWHATAPILARILAGGGNTTESQHAHLEFYQKHLIPALGPFPNTYYCALGHTGLPVEFSVNYRQHGGRPDARVSIEPVNEKSGTATDLLNEEPSRKFTARLSGMGISDYDSQLTQHLDSALALTEGERLLLRDRTIEDDVRSQMAFGFDLKETGIVCKRYSFPGLRIQLTGQSLADLLSDKIRSLQPTVDYASGFKTIQKLMQEDGDLLDHSIFSWDCVSPSRSRLKFYGLSNDITWARIEKVWTKNGRAQTPAEVTGLQRLRKLWDLLGLTECVLSHTLIFEDRVQQPSGSPLVWNYEIKPGSSNVDAKVYLPVYGVSDDRVVTALSQFFQYLGLKELAATYRTTVQSIFPDHDLKQTDRLTSWISFAYTDKNGVYLSVYYHSSTDYPSLKKE